MLQCVMLDIPAFSKISKVIRNYTLFMLKYRESNLIQNHFAASGRKLLQKLARSSNDFSKYNCKFYGKH